MDTPIVNIVGLCSGVGWLEEAVALGLEHLGYRSRVACCAEWDAYAAACLLARMEEASLEPAPIWCGDLRDFDARPFRGVVDVLCAGLPCQPYSAAGKQHGLADARSYGDDGSGPIPQFLRIVAECRPAVVFCENVPPWIRGGYFRPVGEELSRLGYTIESPLFVAAASVGAAHQRERAFVLAHAPHADFTRQRRQRDDLPRPDDVDLAHALRRERQPWAGRQRVLDGSTPMGNDSLARADAVAAGSGPRHPISEPSGDVGDAQRIGQRTRDDAVHRVADHPHEGQPERTNGGRGDVADAANTAGRSKKPQRQKKRRVASRWPSDGLAYAQCKRPQGDGPSDEEWRRLAESCGPDGRIFAPGPAADWSAIPEPLWPAIKPGFCVLVDGRAVALDESRAAQLRCGGNGVVALAAAVAFVELMRRAVE